MSFEDIIIIWKILRNSIIYIKVINNIIYNDEESALFSSRQYVRYHFTFYNHIYKRVMGNIIEHFNQIMLILLYR